MLLFNANRTDIFERTTVAYYRQIHEILYQLQESRKTDENFFEWQKWGFIIKNLTDSLLLALWPL